MGALAFILLLLVLLAVAAIAWGFGKALLNKIFRGSKKQDKPDKE